MTEAAKTKTIGDVRRSVFGFGLPSWEAFMLWSLGAAALAAVAVVMTTNAVVLLQRAENKRVQQEFEAYKVEAGEKTAKAMVDAATANAEAARLRLELDREIQKRAQRLLTDEQRDAIRNALQGRITEIAIVAQHDLEARAYELQIASAIPKGAKIYVPEPPREDKWFAPAGLIMYSPAGSNVVDLKDDPLYRALKAANLFGGTTGQPFISPDLRGPSPALIPGYKGHVLYVGQKSPF